MAALSEADLIACLGPNFREAERAFDAANKGRSERRELQTQMEKAEDNKFNAGATVLVGIALIGSAFYRATGLEFQIQFGLGAAFIAVGVWAYNRLQNKLKDARAKIEILKAEMAA